MSPEEQGPAGERRAERKDRELSLARLVDHYARLHYEAGYRDGYGAGYRDACDDPRRRAIFAAVEQARRRWRSQGQPPLGRRRSA